MRAVERWDFALTQLPPSVRRTLEDRPARNDRMPPFELDGRRYVVVTGSAGADEALLHLRDAAQMIERLVAPGQ